MNDQNVRLKINTGQQQKLEIGPGTAPRQNLQMGNTVPVFEKNYDRLINKPKINGVMLEGDKSNRQLKIEVTDPLTNFEIEAMLAEIFN